jgi:DNA replication protein DnaC
MKAAVDMVLQENLKALKLSTMLSHLKTCVRQAQESSHGYEEFLLNLTETELQFRKENRLKRLLREAKFPLLKTLEGFDLNSAPGLDGRLLKELSAGQYIREPRNIILLGRTGTGKTHLATGLAVEACKEGVRTRFVTCSGLVNELMESRDDKRLSRVVNRYAGYDLLILDELGYVPFSKEGAELLFQVLAERHERRAVIITTNLGFADWTKVFGDANLTAALLDRVTHRAHIINCTWESHRLQETLKNQQKRQSEKKLASE